jgi:hypothetical protein
LWGWAKCSNSAFSTKESNLPTYPQGLAIIPMHHSVMPYHTSLMFFFDLFLLPFAKDEAWMSERNHIRSWLARTQGQTLVLINFQKDSWINLSTTKPADKRFTGKCDVSKCNPTTSLGSKTQSASWTSCIMLTIKRSISLFIPQILRFWNSNLGSL